MQILRVYQNMLRYINTDYKGLRCIKDKKFHTSFLLYAIVYTKASKFKYLTQINKILIC